MRSVIVLVLVACGAKSPPPPPPSCPAGPHVMTAVELQDFQQKMCACQDDECRNNVLSGDTLISFDQLKTLAQSCHRAGGALDELDQIKATACACKDATCAADVEKTFEDWSKRYADTKGSQKDAETAGKVISDISECLVKAQMGETPAEDPGSSH